MNKILDSELKEILASRSASYTFLARVYQQEPTIELLQSLVTAVNANPDETGEGEQTLNSYLRGLAGQDLSQPVSELATEYAGMFLNAGKHPVHPFESVYTSAEKLLMQGAYQDIVKEYRQAGLTRAHGFNEPEDHLALEFEFMAHLGRKSQEALEAGNLVAGLEYLEKQHAFLKEHLLVWVPRFCQDVKRVAQSGFYLGIAALTLEILNAETETLPELIAEVRELK